MTSRGMQFTAAQRFLHWLMAACILTMFFIGVGFVGYGNYKLKNRNDRRDLAEAAFGILALIPAVIVGGINGILLVRTKSVWPGVIVHAVNNGLGASISLLIS